MKGIIFWCLASLLMQWDSVLGDEIDNANEYIDQLLDNLRNDPVISNRVEPIHVPNIKQRHFEGTNIYVKGLSSLRRDENCKISLKEGSTVVIEANLKPTGIKFDLDYKAKGGIIPISIRGKAEGKIEGLNIRAVVSVSPYDGIGKLEQFEVSHFGRFRVIRARGATFALNWLIKIIADNMVRRSKDVIIDGIEHGVSKLLEEKLSEVKISARRFNRQ